MTLEEFLEHLEESCDRVVAEEANRLAAEIRRMTPANRLQTRQAVRVRRNGSQARILLQFPRRVGGTNTPTHKRFRTQWSQLRPLAKQRVISDLIFAINEG